MELAIVRARYTPYGGAEQFVARIVEQLRAGGAKVTIVTRRWQQGVAGGQDVVACNPFYIGSLWRDWGFARSACAALAKLRPTLVQSHERIACCDVYRAGDGVHREWLRQRSRVLGPFGKLRVAIDPYHHYVKAAERKLFSSSRLRAVICNSRMVKAEIAEWFHLPEAKLHVIYSGVDTTRFTPKLKPQHREVMRRQLDIPADAPLLLFVGSGFERKGLGVAIRALVELRAAYLAVVGQDKQSNAYARLAAQCGVAARVRFAGAVNEVAAFYGAGDALVLPTLYDPFPNVALEAMASGLPVLTSRKSGAAELISNGVDGWVCDALDLPAWVDAARRTLDPHRLPAMQAKARARAEPFTLEATARQYLALYESLIAEAEVVTSKL